MTDDEDIHSDTDGSGGSGEGSGEQEIQPTVVVKKLTFPKRRPVLNVVATGYPMFTWDWKKFITEREASKPTTVTIPTPTTMRPNMIPTSKYIRSDYNRVDICK